MVYTHENIQFSESVVKYNLINFLNLLIDMGSLSGAGRLFHNVGPLNLIDRFPNVDWVNGEGAIKKGKVWVREGDCQGNGAANRSGKGRIGVALPLVFHGIWKTAVRVTTFRVLKLVCCVLSVLYFSTKYTPVICPPTHSIRRFPFAVGYATEWLRLSVRDYLPENVTLGFLEDW